MENRIRILAVDDEPDLRSLLRILLVNKGYEVIEASSGTEAVEQMKNNNRIDLVIMDIMMPGLSGVEACAKIREFSTVPMLFLTAKTAVANRVRGLRMGAQDYMLKPFEPAELLARVENILRRTKKDEQKLDCGRLHIDFGARRVTRCGSDVPLTALEFDLLAVLARRRNMAMSREELLAAVWGYDYAGETRTVDVHVQRLRSKIGAAYIETVYKFGYRFTDHPEGLA